MKHLNPKAWLAALSLMILMGCAQLGVPAADSFNKKALAAHQTVTAIAQTATTLRQAGKLSDADRDNIVATLKGAEAGIDLATLAAKTNADAGATKLDASIAVLTALQTYLLTKGK
jgi:hypothetical protein